MKTDGHETMVYVDRSDKGVAYWRAGCNCGWKSLRYSQMATAGGHESRHHAVVAAGEWTGPNPVDAA